MRNRNQWTSWAALTVVGAAILAGPSPVDAHQDSTRGTPLDSDALLQGVVGDEVTMAPISAATVSVVGMDDQAVITQRNGTFALPDAPLGTLTLRAAAPGYAASLQQVEVQPDRVVFVQFLLPSITAVLDEIVVTGRRDDDPLTDGADLTAADLLALRVPSARVTPGQVGATNYGIQLRSPTSLQQNTDPVILIDGVRVGDAASALEILSRIPASEVESMEILRGPATASVVAPDAANGVISIRTRGRGPPPDR